MVVMWCCVPIHLLQSSLYSWCLMFCATAMRLRDRRRKLKGKRKVQRAENSQIYHSCFSSYSLFSFMMLNFLNGQRNAIFSIFFCILFLFLTKFARFNKNQSIYSGLKNLSISIYIHFWTKWSNQWERILNCVKTMCASFQLFAFTITITHTQNRLQSSVWESKKNAPTK